MTAAAAGLFRRTDVERSDQRVAWERTDQAFFASGACHILAWACREIHSEQPISVAAVRFEGEQQVMHSYATWNEWAFDHSGWNLEADLLAANVEFEDCSLERVDIDISLHDFCQQHSHRMPDQYWRNPVTRARAYVGLHRPPWA